MDVDEFKEIFAEEAITHLSAVERGILGLYDPERGRFRTFLLAALGNYLSKQVERSTALKRGAGQPDLSLGRRLQGTDPFRGDRAGPVTGIPGWASISTGIRRRLPPTH